MIRIKTRITTLQREREVLNLVQIGRLRDGTDNKPSPRMIRIASIKIACPLKQAKEVGIK